MNFVLVSTSDGYIDNNLDLDDNLFCISNDIDDCGICDGNNADQDCNGTCFGSAELDDCGICDGNNADQDCNGTCFGSAELDDCGICDGNNAEQDCNGTCFGSAELDDCGICDGNNEQCIEQIFTSLPYNLHALINQDEILISWDFDLELDQSFVNGFNIYHGFNEIDLTLISSTQSIRSKQAILNMGFFVFSI